jgi:hypothetical protein
MIEERREITLLKAVLEILGKADSGPNVEDIFSLIAAYDGTDCDGRCLMEDIKDYLKYEADQ